MHRLSDDLLLHSYETARSIERIDKEFLDLLKVEIEKRGLFSTNKKENSKNIYH